MTCADESIPAISIEVIRNCRLSHGLPSTLLQRAWVLSDRKEFISQMGEEGRPGIRWLV